MVQVEYYSPWHFALFCGCTGRGALLYEAEGCDPEEHHHMGRAGQNHQCLVCDRTYALVGRVDSKGLVQAVQIPTEPTPCELNSTWSSLRSILNQRNLAG